MMHLRLIQAHFGASLGNLDQSTDVRVADQTTSLIATSAPLLQVIMTMWVAIVCHGLTCHTHVYRVFTSMLARMLRSERPLSLLSTMLASHIRRL